MPKLFKSWMRLWRQQKIIRNKLMSNFGWGVVIWNRHFKLVIQPCLIRLVSTIKNNWH